MKAYDNKRSIAAKKAWASRRARQAYVAAPAVVIPEFLKKPDPINPAHYKGAIECIDYIEAILTTEEYRGYLRGSMVKYQHRLLTKGSPAENLGKLQWYAERLNQAL